MPVAAAETATAISISEKMQPGFVTGDSTVSALHCAGTIEDNEGKTVTVKGIDGTVYVKGDGSYTITVTSYEDSADLSEASTTTSWSAYETEKPAELE